MQGNCRKDGTDYKLYSPSENELIHLSIVYTGEDYLVYINGSFEKKIATSKLTTGGKSGNYLSGTQHGARLYNGGIDELRFYNRTLSEPEILDIYNSEKP